MFKINNLSVHNQANELVPHTMSKLISLIMAPPTAMSDAWLTFFSDKREALESVMCDVI